jgi:hypothetical protein
VARPVGFLVLPREDYSSRAAHVYVRLGPATGREDIRRPGTASALAAFQTGRGEAHRAEDTVLAFLVTFVGYMVFRGAAEGLIDSYRAAEGRVSKADVGQ